MSARAVGSPTDPVGTRIGSIEASPGELRFVVDLAGTSREIWIRSSVPVVSGADAAVALALTPAMTVPGPLRVDAPVDELFARRVPEIQGIFRSWAKSGEWPGIEAARHQVELLCPRSETPPCDPDAGVGAFFSGGVDSFATLLRNPEITDLIYIQGFDVPVGDLFAAYHARMRDTVGRVADGLDKSLITVETNARELYEPTLKGPAFGGGFRAGVVRFLAPRLGRIYTASGLHYDRLAPNSGHPLLDHLWGAGRVEFVHDGAELRRVDKLELIAGNTIAQATLRVCWADPESERNCGRCEKCLRTMVALEALGARERFETFPPELDLEAVAAVRPALAGMVAYWQENLDLAREQQAGPELVAAIEACLAGVAPPEADAGGPLDMVAADEYRRLRIAHERAEARVDELSRLAAWQEARLRDMSESLSWRLTAVLRRARSGLRRSAARSGGGR